MIPEVTHPAFTVHPGDAAHRGAILPRGIRAQSVRVPVAGQVLGFLLGFSVTASPFLEVLWPGRFRHLTPFYLATLILILSQMVLGRSRGISFFRLPVWLWAMGGLAVLATAMLRGLWADLNATADAARYAYVAVLLAVCWEARGGLAWRKAGLAGIIVGGVVFTGGVAQWNPLDIVIPGRFEPLINRNLSGSVFFAGALACVELWLEGGLGRILRRLLAVTTIFFAYMVVVTFSRGSLVATACATAALALYVRRSSHRMLIVAASVAVMAAAVVWTQDVTTAYELEKIDDAEAFSAGRTPIWQSIVEAVPSNLAGVGTGRLWALVGQSDTFLTSQYGRAGGTANSAHSIYLKALAENGIAGAFLLGVFVVGLLRHCWRLRRMSPLPLAAALFTAVYLVFCDYSFPAWLLVGLSFPAQVFLLSPLEPAARARNPRANGVLWQRRRAGAS